MTVPTTGRDAVGSPAYDCDPDLKRYNRLFVQSYTGPYGLQWPGKPWKTRDKPISDPLISAHLAQTYWVAKAASFYPGFAYLDFDARRPPADAEAGSGRDGRRHTPADGILDRISEALDRLKVSAGQYQLMSSPSYGLDGSLHLALRLELGGAPVMCQYAYAVLHRLVGDLCEVYPQRRRKFRLPLGRDQHLLAEDLRPLPHLRWQEAMGFLDKVDPVPVDALPYRPPPGSLPPAPEPDEEPRDPPEDDPRKWPSREECERLWRHGLQHRGTRHHSQWKLAISCLRDGIIPEEAVGSIKRWIHKSHNDLSDTVNRGKWREIYSEINRQVAWLYRSFKSYPDDVHNRTCGLTLDDLRWIAHVFPGDLINQRRLARLVNYYRPRSLRHEEVFIPFHRWYEIAHERHYRGFIDELMERGLLESDMRYWHDPDHPRLSYCRKFRLRLPPAGGEPLQRDGRNLDDYDEVLFAAYGSVSEIAAATGVRRQRFYDYLSRERRRPVAA